MGQWNISIQGHGIHDNGRDDDAEAMTKEFVESLIENGHVVTEAHFTVGHARKLRGPIPSDYEDGKTPEPTQWVDADISSCI